MFDKKVIRNCIIILLIIVLIFIAINFIRRTFSRYESDGKSLVKPDLAFWVVNESITSRDVMLEGIIPLPTGAPDPETYIKNVDFTIQNYRETISSEVPLKYEIKLFSTTNLPLQYELYQYADDGLLKNAPCTVSNELITDEYGTVYREIKALPNRENLNDFFFEKVEGEDGKEIDKFRLKIWLPNSDDVDEYKNYIFEDLIDYIKVEIRATQIISEDENK